MTNTNNKSKNHNDLMNSPHFVVWRLLDQVEFAVTRLRDMELAKSGVTPEQARILGMLYSRGGKIKITEVSQILMRKRHSVSTLLDRMNKRGLVDKIKYPGSRELEIVMTEMGRNLYKKIPIETFENVFSALSKDDVQKLSQYLQLLLVRSLDLLKIDNNFPLKS